MAYTFNLCQRSFEFVDYAVFVFWKLNLNEKGFESEGNWFFTPAFDLAVSGEDRFNLGFEGVEVFDDVFWEDFVGD